MFSNKKSQSLIESVVAISIVVIAVVGIMSVGLAHLSLGGQSAEMIIAINLAREGIEIVSATRNSNLLDATQSWPYGLTNGSYRVGFDPDDPDGFVMTSASFDGGDTVEYCTNCCLYQDADAEYYYHKDDCSTLSQFHRLITIENGDNLGENCSNDCEKKIVSSVYWEERGRPHTISFEVHFTDWR